ncbi:MAG: homoserine dehydrogenase [Rikenellaceae bacterium]
MSKIKIGLFGYGVVGEGLNAVLAQAANAHAEIVKICVKSRNKKRNLDDSYFTYDADDIFNNPEINLIVELIDDADESYKIVKRALQSNIAVVSGNKKMLAYNLPELIELQKTHNTALLYDASSCGSIPVIRNLEEYYDNDLLLSVKGILNGSSNFILSKIFNENKTYSAALKEAQDLGFAESNPTFDVEGYDSLFKLIIITVHAFGTYVHPDNALNYGISRLSEYDIKYAREKGLRIKLLADVSKISDNEITMQVLPCFVPPDKYIYSVEDEFNGVVIKGQFYDKQFMFGRGAGGHPTGSSVLSDITARGHDYKYEYKKLNLYRKMSYTTDWDLKLYVRYNDDTDILKFKFKDISERYWSEDYKFMVGTISLSDLIKLKEELQTMDIFIAKLYN